MATISSLPSAGRAAIRLGFVPLSDCAPLVVAAEHGLFRRRGLKIRLFRELGWATIRDKLTHGELDLAHAPCPMPFTLRTGPLPVEAITGLVLNLNGNAITLSESLWKAGVRDAATLARHARTLRGQMLTFGIVSTQSSHGYLIRKWLQKAGVNLDLCRFVVVPPPQMTANLKAGHLDGFCAGEPWNTEAVADGCGWIATTSSSLEPLHPEKVLIARADFEARLHEEHVAVISALIEACRYCDNPANHADIIELLTRREYLNLPASVVRRSWSGATDFGHGRTVPDPEFVVFHRHDANEPSGDKAGWIANNLLEPATRASFTSSALAKIFRTDLYAEAAADTLPFPSESDADPESENENETVSA
jgi:ABC-type nitrate/sulfonate/bicarbonate transport system substrate-binding protein